MPHVLWTPAFVCVCARSVRIDISAATCGQLQTFIERGRLTSASSFTKMSSREKEKKQLFGLMLKNMPNGWYQSQVNTLNMPILFKSSILLKPKLLQWLCNLSTKLPWVLHFYQTSPYAPLCVIALSLSGLRIIMVVFLPKVLGASFCWRKRPHDCNFISLSPALCTAALSFHCICITGQNPQRSRQNLGWK